MNTALDYRQQLRKALESRSAKNPRYSMRAFARQIGMSPSHLCRVINGQKDISANAALRIASELNLRGKETEHFLDLVSLASTNGHAKEELQKRIEKKTKRRQRKSVELDHFHLIADWYHFVLFELAKTSGFRNDPKWIAKKLGISVAEAKAGLDRLAALSLLTISPDGQVEITDTAIETPDDISSLAIKKHHEQMSLKAAEAVKTQPVAEREFQSVQLSFTEENMAKAKEAIREFAAKFEDEFGHAAGARDIFQMNLQFFRITQKAKE